MKIRKNSQKKNSNVIVVLWALFAALFVYSQMRFQIITFWPQANTDLAGFYAIRFSDGMSHSPFINYELPARGAVNPVEYPVITSLIVWLTSFVRIESMDGKLVYFSVNCLLNTLVFAGIIASLSRYFGKRSAVLVLLAPAVPLSIFLNWDVWTIFPTILSLYCISKGRLKSGGVLLALAISSKFFPVVLILPKFIESVRQKKFKELQIFLASTIIAWISINLPIFWKYPEGWLYFYKFSFRRQIGEGSLFNAICKLGICQTTPMWIYYSLNIAIFVFLLFFLIRNPRPISSVEAAFWSILAFTLFGKQYSMQYVLWLTPFAVMAFLQLSKKIQRRNIGYFALWQFSELFMHFAYFSNLNGLMSNTSYGLFALVRYFSIVIFAYNLWNALYLREWKSNFAKLARKS